MIKGKIDLGTISENLSLLGAAGKESLARRMGVGAGRVFRDEAILQAPKGISEWNAQAQFGGSKHAGLLSASMYVAFNEKASTNTVFVYSISWNRQRAPHGHLIEFGHWRPYAIVFSAKYGWRTDRTRKLPGQGKWVAARPFLGPAYHTGKMTAFDVALNIGKREFPVILQELQAK